MILRDATGKEMNALEVFSGAIHYLKNSLEKMSRKQNATIKQNDIRWVLTVPAIWNDRAKFFMREAANLVFFYYYSRRRNLVQLDSLYFFYKHS